MFFHLLQLICISLIVIFLGQQLFNYIKSNYMIPSSTTTTVNDFKKMYEKMATTIKSHNNARENINQNDADATENQDYETEDMQSELTNYLENLSSE